MPVRYFLKNLILLFSKDAFNLIKRDSKFIYSVTKDTKISISNKSCSLYLSKNPEKKNHSFHNCFFNIDINKNVTRVTNLHFIMISERSRDTEVCWKYSFAFTRINYILKYIKIENSILCNNIWQYYCFYCIFDQINAALKTIRDFVQKHKINCTDKIVPKILQKSCLLYVSYYPKHFLE